MSKITQKQNLNQKLSPQQILQSKLFQLNSFSLEQRLYKEMEKNPLLELSDNNDVINDEQEPETQQDVDDFEIGKVDLRFKKEFNVWVVRDKESIYALSTVCTHLGCTPNWLEAEKKFKCPCHGSGFRSTGMHFEGPAPRPL